MLSFFFLMLLRPPTSTLFPYTTLFRSRRRRLGFGLAETLLGFGLGLALGFLVLAMAVFLGLAAGLGGFALGLLDAFLAVAALGFFFREAALFDVALFCVRQCASARGAFVFSQRA